MLGLWVSVQLGDSASMTVTKLLYSAASMRCECSQFHGFAPQCSCVRGSVQFLHMLLQLTSC